MNVNAMMKMDDETVNAVNVNGNAVSEKNGKLKLD
jgi:hypothetical protein